MTTPDLPCGARELLAAFGHIDIYVFDQLLRGRLGPEMRVLDAGCGGGRNAAYLMRCGGEVFGVDSNREQIDRIQKLAAEVAPHLPAENFRVGDLADLPFPDGRFDAVICSAVLHFADDASAFEGMLAEMWRVLAPGGVFFSRLASSIGIEDDVVHVGGRRHRLPDGSERFLVDEAYLGRLAADLRAEPLDPVKTTIVEGMRAMTTWVLRKRGDG
ncbi:MAG: class I SAM-dependent methyltransferase [Gemmatimonadota bacterium]|nr:class I SAM-dependent methyltransferase [Gemmatimonadota bacterium]